MTPNTLPSKVCSSCGRPFTWRKKWERNWESVKVCSDRCRRERPVALDRELERAILELLAGRARGATICPSEAARAVRPNWRPLMERTRRAARRLVARGELEIRQGGQVVDPDSFRGPIRLARTI